MQNNTNHTNLPTLTQRKKTIKSHINIIKNRPSQPTLLTQCQQIIINTEVLPVTFDMQNQLFKEITVVVTASQICGKYGGQCVNLPLNYQKKKWVRIELGQTMTRISAKVKQNQNSDSQTCVFSSYNAWRKNQPKQNQTPLCVSLQEMLNTLKEKKMGAVKKDENKGSLSNHIKKRSNLRTISVGGKPKMATMREKVFKINQNIKEKDQGCSLRKIKKHDSIRFNSNVPFQDVSIEKTADRNSTASNSINSEFHEARFPKRPMRLRHLRGKITQNPTFFQDLGEYAPTISGKPKFYEQIPYTHEQIELKRQKFQSQFVSKKQIPAIENRRETFPTQESEVIEEINRMDNSHFGLDDTLERGVEQGNVVEGDFNLEESGTLCESVFQ